MNKKYLAIFAIAMVALVGIGTVSAFGFGNGMKNISDDDKAEMQEHMDAVRTAIENNDYEAWKSFMESQLTEENFNQMVERHNEMAQFREQIEAAKESGDFESLKELKGEMGFGREHRNGFGDCPLMG
jgi:transcriptional regulator with AAA-type ATPase domain